MRTEESSSLITFRTDSPDHFTENIAPVAPNVTIQPCEQLSFRAIATLTRLPRLGLFHVKMSSANISDTEPLGYLSITVPLDCSFQMMLHGRAETFTTGSAYVAHWDETFDLRIGDRLDTLVVNIDTPLVCDYVRKLQGGEEPQRFQCAPTLSLMTPGSSSFWRYLSFVWSELTRSAALFRSPVVITELEETLVALFLYAVMEEHDAARSPGNDMLGYPGYLRKAEDYLVAHLTEPVSLADLAEVAGIGARTLSKAFHRRRGVGPLGFLKARRLEAAHRALLAAEPTSTTVTDVAMRFGFVHLGRFSAHYRRAFGETPSETLRRS